jgi:uroporphyrinogen-III synthase
MIPAEEPPPEADAICFASPSAVDGFFQKFPEAAASFLNSCAVVAIGPTTAAHVLQRGVLSVTVASTPSAEGFLAALAEVFNARL